ncbi:hypothetical protein EDC01DRAFT_747423 [Geopyxis carbonaria]|nr:hypothetical protein EDC01DRAFT_747423 [Geopyxis carbonaria]
MPPPSSPSLPLPPSFPPTDTILHLPTAPPPPSAPRTLLLFLPGNPGLIGYYAPFLASLAAQHPALTILGASHAGFSGAGDDGERGTGYWDVQAQVDIKLSVLRLFVAHCGGGAAGTGVVLMGHSMGCYLALSMLHAIHSAPPSSLLPRRTSVLGGIMLFPTVVDIAASPSGQRLGALLRSRITATVLAALAAVAALLPAAWVVGIVRVLTGQAPHAAQTTARLVTTPSIVRQAIRLAGDEMRVIGKDRWGKEVWGAGMVAGGEGSGKGKGNGGLVFAFGQNDHWVAEPTRAAIEQTRGAGVREIVLLPPELRHGFCTDLRQSAVVAGMCRAWIGGIVGEGEGEV